MDEFEIFIRDCLLLAHDPSGLPTEAFSTTKRYERKMARFLTDPFGYARRVSRPTWQKVLRVVACAALIGALALGSALAINPAFRDWVVEQFPDSTAIFFSGSQVGMGDPTGWRPTKLPQGYEEVNVSLSGGEVSITYKNQDGTRFLFDCMPVAEGYLFDFDNEHSDQSTLQLNGRTAYLFDSNTEGRPSALQWFSEDGTIAFSLIGWMPSEDLIDTAESVQKEN